VARRFKTGRIYRKNDALPAYQAITDGMSQTLSAGERPRNVADATWAGVYATPVPFCTKADWPARSCDSGMFVVLGRTGGPGRPSDFLHQGSPTPHTPNSHGAGADGFWSRHPGGCSFLFGDGSVRFVKETIAPMVFEGLASRAGGEVISTETY
jgi:prepilin-type processing-associated H-X9-DG protein